MAAALQKLTGRAFVVRNNAGVGIEVAPPSIGVLRRFGPDERRDLLKCLGPVARSGASEVCLFDPVGHIPADDQWPAAVQQLLRTQAAQELLAQARADPGTAYLLDVGQSAIYSSQITEDPPTHQVVLVIWSNTPRLTMLALDANGQLQELPSPAYASAQESCTALEQARQRRWEEDLLHCLACGYAIGSDRKTCPNCGKSYNRFRP